MFPTINHISDLLPYIQGNPQFRVQDQPNGTTVVCYMLQDEDTFRGAHEDWYKECRGITFDTASGEVLSRTLHKFQNVGENDATQPHLIPWDTIVRVMDKRDGSMITFVEIDGKIVAKTKKTFTSDEAIAATEYLYQDPDKVEWVRNWLRAGFTPTFEWTSPRFPIVLVYEKDELTLLQLRHNISGLYMVHTLVDGIIGEQDACPFPVVPNLVDDFRNEAGEVDYALFREGQLTQTGIEGWIVQNGDGEMWKVKTKWYCDLHHSVTFTRWRDVARAVLADQSDDLKAAFAMTGRDIQPIVDVENVINREIDRVRMQCEEYAGYGKGFNRTKKDMAMMHRDHEHFKEIMRTFNGQDIDWNAWYLKKYIDNWSLQVVTPGSSAWFTETPEVDNGRPQQE